MAAAAAAAAAAAIGAAGAAKEGHERSPYYLLLGGAVPIYATIFVGWFSAHRGLVRAAEAVRALNFLVFNVCVPALAFSLLADTDLNDRGLWKFALVFLVYRLGFGAVCAAWTRWRGLGAAHFLTLWICTSWTNSVVLAIPVLQELYGHRDANVAKYAIFAVLPALYTELPAVLFLLARHRLRASASASSPLLEVPPGGGDDGGGGGGAPAKGRPSMAAGIASQMARNPLLLAVCAGTVLGLAAPSRLPLPVENTVRALGQPSVTAALFSCGVYLQGKRLVAAGDRATVAGLLLVKLIAAPLVVWALCDAIGVRGLDARAAVLCSGVAVAQTGFVFAQAFGYGENLVVPCIVLGTLLCFLTFPAMLYAFDHVGLFAFAP